MKRIKISALVLMVVLLAICLGGCGKKSTVTINKDSIYKEQDLNIEFPKGFETTSISIEDNKLLFSGYEYNSKTYESKYSWGFVNLDGSDLKIFDMGGDDCWVENVIALENGNIAVIYSKSEETVDDNGEYYYDSDYVLELCDSNGKSIKKLSLSKEYDIYWMNAVIKNDEGGLTIFNYDAIISLDSSLKESGKKLLTDGEEYNYIYRLKDGSYVTRKWGENGQEFYKVDSHTYAFGEKLEMAATIENYSVMDGNKNYDFLLRGSDGIYGYNVGDEEPTEILNFINSDISTSYFTTFTFLDDNSAIAAYRDWYSDNSEMKISKFVKVAPEDVKDKKYISLGCLYLDSNVRSQVVNFNKSSDEYRITITDYSKFNTEENWDAGSEKMNSDIASGQCPDIIVASDTNTIKNYMNKGLFMDLSKHLDSDPDVDKNDLFPNVLEACSHNGKLYALAETFYINTLIGKKSVVGDRNSWTYEEFRTFIENLPEGMEPFSDVSRDSLLRYIMQINTDDFVDFASAKTNFDSEEFVNLLKTLKNIPELDDNFWYDYDYDGASAAYRENKVALAPCVISGMNDVIYSVKGQFGEPVSYIGYPSIKGNGASITPSTMLAISAKCKYSEGAWNFVKIFISKEHQESITYGIPISMSRFDELAELATQKPFWMDGDEKVEYDNTYWIHGEEIVIDPLTQEEVAEIKNYILSTKTVGGSYPDIETIIDEEAEAFFEGQKSAEEVAKIIQSRASIYINEIQ